MRRPTSRPLPALTDAALSSPADPAILAVTIPLRTITPVVGGGVDPGVPGDIDPVRLPSIRGMLRWWWRAHYQTNGAPEDLFERESSLWGGVDAGRDREGRRSRVRLRVEGTVLAGTLSPAGRHQLNSHSNGLNALPRWSRQELGYALFPLQRSDKERRDAFRDGARNLPTASIRHDLRFDLHLEVWESHGGLPGGVTDVEQVLCSLWAWIHLGGLGARTRRGFGALEVAGALRPNEGRGHPLLKVFGGAFEEGWAEIKRRSAPGSRLDGSRLIVGREDQGAEEAHATAVDSLRRFRQAPIGRSQTSATRYGHSNWPEADTLRALAGLATYQDTPAGPDGCAPRAAFGLPIEVAFKDDHDKGAEATLRPARSNRWSSPLLLRPVRARSGKYQPMALALSGEPPTRVEVRFKARETRQRVEAASRPPSAPTLPVEGFGRARPSILDRLRRHHGDALGAFLEWLTAEAGFRTVNTRENPR